MQAVVEFDPTRPSGEGQIPGRGSSSKKRRRRKHIVSETSRALILQEVGIDPDAAQEAYWYDREARQNRAARKDELARQKASDDLRRNAEEVAAAREAMHEAALEAPIVSTEDVTDTFRTLVFSAFLLFGLAGFLMTFLSPPAWVTWGVSGTLAAFVCGYLLLNREEEIPFPLIANFLKA